MTTWRSAMNIKQRYAAYVENSIEDNMYFESLGAEYVKGNCLQGIREEYPNATEVGVHLVYAWDQTVGVASVFLQEMLWVLTGYKTKLFREVEAQLMEEADEELLSYAR